MWTALWLQLDKTSQLEQLPGIRELIQPSPSTTSAVKPVQRYEQEKRKYFAHASFPHFKVLDVAHNGFMSWRKQRIQARKIPHQLLGSTPAGAAKLTEVDLELPVTPPGSSRQESRMSSLLQWRCFWVLAEVRRNIKGRRGCWRWFLIHVLKEVQCHLLELSSAQSCLHMSFNLNCKHSGKKY